MGKSNTLTRRSFYFFFPPWLLSQVSLPKGKGVKLTILEEKAAKIKKAQNN